MFVCLFLFFLAISVGLVKSYYFSPQVLFHLILRSSQSQRNYLKMSVRNGKKEKYLTQFIKLVKVLQPDHELLLNLSRYGERSGAFSERYS